MNVQDALYGGNYREWSVGDLEQAIAVLEPRPDALTVEYDRVKADELGPKVVEHGELLDLATAAWRAVGSIMERARYTGADWTASAEARRHGLLIEEAKRAGSEVVRI